MDDATGAPESEMRKVISKNEQSVTLMVKKIEEEQWQLSVENEYGIRSVWLELFSTEQQAIDAGVDAVDKEGIESFVSTEGFEYLHDENV